MNAMQLSLTVIEARLLGALIEKEAPRRNTIRCRSMR
jgi:uncharacterized protein YceH (UPF0502 family)